MDRDYTNRLKKIVDRLSDEDVKHICRVICRDPFTDIYPMLLILYVFISVTFLLWPFDLFSSVKNDAIWIKYSKGIEFLKIGQAESNSSNQEFYDRLAKGNGLTLEMWLQTEDLYQTGPARVLSYSIDPLLRNFTVGQSLDQLVVRLRTTKTDPNAVNPHFRINGTFNNRSLRHIVIIYDFIEQRVYINGKLKAQSDLLKGDFSNWDRSCNLVIGNEVTGDRPWKGKIYYAAIYDRPLMEQEIRKNYFSGPWHKTNKGDTERTASKESEPVVRYLFEEGKGDVIHDSGSLSKPLNLSIPEYIRHKRRPFLEITRDDLQRMSRISDLIVNILIFIPLGILIHGMLRTRYGLTIKMSLITLLAGILFSLGIESIQHFSLARSSSLIDVFMNMTGIAIGIVMDRFYNLFLNYRCKRLYILLNDRKE